ncbi:hypothetical protein Ahy_B03g065707 [Arachis hypogaea]|uniref:Zinc knuckle CX2CX4HX4C domain-containing protein n=1 Tax=Arachis hypogaea TaxID=3818 RepID=A0A445A259_ARAHY|nr:hypothetical protein Ahy_B03g065707 [Arachis hypogaea]
MRGGFVRGGASRSHEPRREPNAEQDLQQGLGKKVKKNGEGKEFSGSVCIHPRVDAWMEGHKEGEHREHSMMHVDEMPPEEESKKGTQGLSTFFANIVKTGKSVPQQGDPSAEVNREDEAEKVGRTLKVDSNTTEVSRGKFAKICVEVELDKSLVSQYLINGIPHAVEYKELYLVCFSYKRVGHDRENCPEKKKNASEAQNDNGKNTARNPEVEERDKNVNDKIDKGKKVQWENDGGFCPWMLVQRHTRGKENCARKRTE